MKNNYITIFLLLLLCSWLLLIFKFENSSEFYFIIIIILTLLILIFIIINFDKITQIHRVIISLILIVLSLESYFNYSDKIFYSENHLFWSYLGQYKNKFYNSSRSSGNPYNYIYSFVNENNEDEDIFIKINKSTYNSPYNDTLKNTIVSNLQSLIKWNLNESEIEKNKYPIKHSYKILELGNNSYEYAKYEPFTAYENFGLNIVYKTHKADAKYIYFKDINGCEQKIENYSICDTFLVYSNINPKFFDGWHVCNQQETTPEALSKVPEDGYGYIFRGKIYSMEETEQYWNIIDQYKQGMRE